MKVNFVSQVLSCGVANALENCAKHLKLCQFDSCMPTVRLNPISDYLYVFVPRHWKKAPSLHCQNQTNSNFHLDEVHSNISSSKDEKDKVLHVWKEKSGFNACWAVIAPLKYILSSRLSIEGFFLCCLCYRRFQYQSNGTEIYSFQ